MRKPKTVWLVRDDDGFVEFFPDGEKPKRVEYAGTDDYPSYREWRQDGNSCFHSACAKQFTRVTGVTVRKSAPPVKAVVTVKVKR